jgi:biotin operon repressor
MTQAQVIKALQNGSLTSHEVANLTGMPQATVLSTAKKLRSQGKLTIEQVKVGRHWVAQYTLADNEIEKQDSNVKIICGIKTYGIFTKAEYAQMKAQATRLFGKVLSKGISNHQSI